MELPYKCPMCSRTFRTPQGRRGHLTFKHGMGKRSIYTDAIGKIIDGYQEGIELVKEKRRRIPKSAVSKSPEKRAKALAFANELAGRGEGYEIENGDDIEFEDLGKKEEIVFENERRGDKKRSGFEERRGDGRSSGVTIYDIE